MIFAVSIRNKHIYHMGKDRPYNVPSEAYCGAYIPPFYKHPTINWTNSENSHKCCENCRKISNKKHRENMKEINNENK